MRAALFCIFTYLDTKTLLRAAEVCRDWKFVARHPAVWTRVLLENARISSKVNTVNKNQPGYRSRSISAVCSEGSHLSPRVPLVVPEHRVPVVHPDALPHPAEPQTTTARQEGDQGGVPEEHTVRRRDSCTRVSKYYANQREVLNIECAAIDVDERKPTGGEYIYECTQMFLSHLMMIRM